MKPTGHVRKIDELGRIVIPIEIRRELHLEPQIRVEILVEGDGIVFERYQDKCIFCGGIHDVHHYGEKSICDPCRTELLKQV